jgi:hypothetical protein
MRGALEGLDAKRQHHRLGHSRQVLQTHRLAAIGHATRARTDNLRV